MSRYDIICHRGGIMRKVELRMNEKEKYEVKDSYPRLVSFNDAM